MNYPDYLRYYLGFNLVPGIGPTRLSRLIERTGSVADAWRADAFTMAAAGLDTRSIRGLQEIRRSRDLDAELAAVARHGVRLVCREDAEYPRLLAEIPTAPPLLYLRGSLVPSDDLAVAIVGTRNPTAYGTEAAYRITQELAAAGVVIVSGLALGIDTVVHQAALDAGGRTLAVLACGLDAIYPATNRKLAHQITEQGALISDYPLGTQPSALNFPPRNRIISGLSLATVVVEASAKSGSLITVEFALEQGRDVFAVPGSIFSARSIGCHHLIRSGAGVATCAEDILAALQVSQAPEQLAARTELPADPVEAALVQQLSFEPQHIDHLGRECGISAAQAAAALSMLELKGLARQAGPLLYVRQR